MHTINILSLFDILYHYTIQNIVVGVKQSCFKALKCTICEYLQMRYAICYVYAIC